MAEIRLIVSLLILSLGLAACSGGQMRPGPNAKAAEINMRLGINYMQRGEYEIALEKLEKSLQQDPGLPSTHNTIALLYQRLDETDKAEHHFQQSIQLNPEYSQAHNNFGVFLCQQERYQEAETHFLQAIDNPLYQETAQAYENAGLCWYRGGNMQLAEKYLRRALQIDANLPKALINMANVSLQQDKYMQSRGYVQRYDAVAQWTAPALLTAIKTESALGDQNAVSSYIMIMRARFPDSDEMQTVNRNYLIQ